MKNYIKTIEKKEGMVSMWTTVKQKNETFVTSHFRHEKLGVQKAHISPNYTYFVRKYVKGCPFLEVDFQEEPKSLGTPMPIYADYMVCNDYYHQPDSGISVDMSDSSIGYFDTYFPGKDRYPKNEFLFREHGIYPWKEVDISYHQSLADYEPHSYRAESELAMYIGKDKGGDYLPKDFKTLTELGLKVEESQDQEFVYKISHFRDGKKFKTQISKLQSFHFRNERLIINGGGDGTFGNKLLFNLFIILGRNIEIIKKKKETSHTKCSCSRTGTNGWTKDSDFYIKDWFFDGKNIFKTCFACGRWEKVC